MAGLQLTLGHLMAEVTPGLIKTTPTRRAMLEADLHGRRAPMIGETLYIRNRYLEEVEVRVTDLKFFRYQNPNGSLAYPDKPDEGGWMILYEGPLGRNGETQSGTCDVSNFAHWATERHRVIGTRPAVWPKIE